MVALSVDINKGIETPYHKPLTQAQIQERKERKEQQKSIEGQAETDKLEISAGIRDNDVDYVTEAQQQIVRIMKENKLINEDIKGIEIDLDF